MEEWRPVVGWEEYAEVSDQGRVRTVERWVDRTDGTRQHVRQQIRKLALNEGGYWQVTLYKYRSGHTYVVHRLLLEAFIGPNPDGMVALHRNGVRTDCVLTNLHWGTPVENAQDMVRHGTHRNVRKTHCRNGHLLPEPRPVPSTGCMVRSCRICANRRRWDRYVPTSNRARESARFYANMALETNGQAEEDHRGSPDERAETTSEQ